MCPCVGMRICVCKAGSLCYRDKWAMSLIRSYLRGRKSMGYQHMCMRVFVWTLSAWTHTQKKKILSSMQFTEDVTLKAGVYLSLHVCLCCCLSVSAFSNTSAISLLFSCAVASSSTTTSSSWVCKTIKYKEDMTSN